MSSYNCDKIEKMSRHCPIVVCWSIHRDGMFCIHAYREVFNSHAESKETGKDRAWVIRQNSNTESRCLKKHEKQKKKKKGTLMLYWF